MINILESEVTMFIIWLVEMVYCDWSMQKECAKIKVSEMLICQNIKICLVLYKKADSVLLLYYKYDVKKKSFL